MWAASTPTFSCSTSWIFWCTFKSTARPTARAPRASGFRLPSGFTSCSKRRRRRGRPASSSNSFFSRTRRWVGRLSRAFCALPVALSSRRLALSVLRACRGSPVSLPASPVPSPVSPSAAPDGSGPVVPPSPACRCSSLVKRRRPPPPSGAAPVPVSCRACCRPRLFLSRVRSPAPSFSASLGVKRSRPGSSGASTPGGLSAGNVLPVSSGPKRRRPLGTASGGRRTWLSGWASRQLSGAACSGGASYPLEEENASGWLAVALPSSRFIL